MKKVLSLVGARPQFIKEALVGKTARAAGLWRHEVVHSGQHYDAALSDIFFEELGIPAPDYHLGIGSGSHAAMTAAALTGMEQVLQEQKPDALLVYGDTNTTLAGALAAAKLHIPVIHIEAGIRMLPKTMPEEINRVLTDHAASAFCCCSQYEVQCLKHEGLTENVFLTGDVMYDVYKQLQPHFTPEAACLRHGVTRDNFAVVTIHRDYNVDDKARLESILGELEVLATSLPVLFFLHPRTKKRIAEFGLQTRIKPFLCAAPEGYVGLMSLLQHCTLVITDSGGLQKEAYYAKKRAIVVMPDTGWRALVDCGWNVLAGESNNGIRQAMSQICGSIALYPENVYGDGNAAQHIVKATATFLGVS